MHFIKILVLCFFILVFFFNVTSTPITQVPSRAANLKAPLFVKEEVLRRENREKSRRKKIREK